MDSIADLDQRCQPMSFINLANEVSLKLHKSMLHNRERVTDCFNRVIDAVMLTDMMRTISSHGLNPHIHANVIDPSECPIADFTLDVFGNGLTIVWCSIPDFTLDESGNDLTFFLLQLMATRW